MLARCYHANTLRLLGGEPLLNPALPEIANEARKTGIADKIKIVTNGVLLARADERLWGTIDIIEISEYPCAALSSDSLKRVVELASKYDVVIQGKSYFAFRESYSEKGARNPEFVKRIYATCEIRKHWGCHSVQGGHFYKCPQAHILARDRGSPTVDGVALHEPDLAMRLEAYLTSPKPLVSCWRCLGSVGRLVVHEQLDRRGWRIPQAAFSEDLVDWDLLRSIENGSTTDAETHYKPWDEGRLVIPTASGMNQKGEQPV
jgi:hypothetical protein